MQHRDYPGHERTVNNNGGDGVAVMLHLHGVCQAICVATGPHARVEGYHVWVQRRV